MATPARWKKSGKQYKVTRERIRQIEAKALRKLRHPTRVRHLQGLPRKEKKRHKLLNQFKISAGQVKTCPVFVIRPEGAAVKLLIRYMKNLIGIILISVLTGCAAQLSPLAPEWKATVKVVDEAAQPIPNATVIIGYYVPPPAGESIALAKKTGLTNTNGVFSASERSRSYDLTFKAQKEGYYPSSQIYELGHPSQYNASEWSPSLTLALKKIGQPIPMYAKRVNTHVPVMNKPLGFDLMAGDWVAPNGRGKDTDILFRASMNERAKDDFDYKLVVSFPNPGGRHTTIHRFRSGESQRPALSSNRSRRWL